MINLITVKRKKHLEWCEKALKIDSGLVKRLRSALNESEAECGREREYSASLRNKVKQLEAVIVFEDYKSVAASLADCSVCGHDRADIIEDGEVFHVECFACGERTGEHESYQCAAKEWSEWFKREK